MEIAIVFLLFALVATAITCTINVVKIKDAVRRIERKM